MTDADHEAEALILDGLGRIFPGDGILAEETGIIVTDIHSRPLDFSCGSELKANRGVICAAPSFHGAIGDAIRKLALYA